MLVPFFHLARNLHDFPYYDEVRAIYTGERSPNIYDTIKKAERRDIRARAETDIISGHLNESLKRDKNDNVFNFMPRKSGTLPKHHRRYSELSQSENESSPSSPTSPRNVPKHHRRYSDLINEAERRKNKYKPRVLRRHSIHSNSVSPKLRAMIQQAEQRDERAMLDSDVVEGRLHSRIRLSRSLSSLSDGCKFGQMQSRKHVHVVSCIDINNINELIEIPLFAVDMSVIHVEYCEREKN